MQADHHADSIVLGFSLLHKSGQAGRHLVNSGIGRATGAATRSTMWRSWDGSSGWVSPWSIKSGQAGRHLVNSGIGRQSDPSDDRKRGLVSKSLDLAARAGDLADKRWVTWGNGMYSEGQQRADIEILTWGFFHVTEPTDEERADQRGIRFDRGIVGKGFLSLYDDSLGSRLIHEGKFSWKVRFSRIWRNETDQDSVPLQPAAIGFGMLHPYGWSDVALPIDEMEAWLHGLKLLDRGMGQGSMTLVVRPIDGNRPRDKDAYKIDGVSLVAGSRNYIRDDFFEDRSRG